MSQGHKKNSPKNWAAIRRRARRVDQSKAKAEKEAAREAFAEADARPPTATFKDVHMGYVGPGKGNAQAAIHMENGKLVGERLTIERDSFKHGVEATDSDIDLTDSDV